MHLIKTNQKQFWIKELTFLIKKEKNRENSLKLRRIKEIIERDLSPNIEAIKFFEGYVNNIIISDDGFKRLKQYLLINKQLSFLNNAVDIKTKSKNDIGRGKPYWPKYMKGSDATRTRINLGDSINNSNDNFYKYRICPICGKKMKLKKGIYGEFYSCPDYPKCSGSKGLL